MARSAIARHLRDVGYRTTRVITHPSIPVQGELTWPGKSLTARVSGQYEIDHTTTHQQEPKGEIVSKRKGLL